MNPKIILATSSPHRKKAFELIGLNYLAEGSNVNEYFNGRPNSPEELTLHLSRLKGEAIAKKYSQGIIIGFDSVGFFKGRILEKPKSKKEAFERLKKLSGNNYNFYTGIYLINTKTNQKISRGVKTEVQMRNLTNQEIKKYLEEDPTFNTYAQGFNPLGKYSSTFIKQIKGSYNNILRGIPLEMIVEMLQKVGYK